MKLDYKKVMWVGFAFMLIQAFWMAYDAIVPLMLVNKFGMNHTWSGFFMALDNILAVVLLPVFGSLSDRSKFKMGKRKPFVLIGTLCAVVCFFGLSFVDYAQVKNLGAQADMPDAFQSNAASMAAHELFWGSNEEVPNAEYSKTNSNNNNKLGEEVALQDYVAHILYGKSYSSLSEVQKETAKQWFLHVDFNTSYNYKLKDGVPTYEVYHFSDGETAYRVLFKEDGAMVTVDKNGAEVVLDETCNLPEGTEIVNDAEAASELTTANVYSILVSEARSDYARSLTMENPTTLILFIVMLLLTLIAMAVFRSPAVALMPDVVVRPLRSSGNAVINLMGTVGGIVVLALGVVMGTDKVNKQMMPYMGYIGILCVVMLACLAIFMWKVKEPLWHAQMLRDQRHLDKKEEEESKAEEVEASNDVIKPEGQPVTVSKAGEEKKEEPKKQKLGKGELLSLLFLLASVAFWYMGYNAVSSKYSLYAVNELGMAYNLVLIVAQVVGIISFFPIGILSGKIGRKKTILIGVGVLAAAFVCACFVTRNTPEWVPYVLFSFAGVGWAAINVNSFPMVVEIAGHGDVGKFTGYYYTASMAAQIATPLLSGFIMDLVGSMSPLFIYGSVFVILSFITMLFVRHGDSRPEGKKSGLEYLDAGDD